MRWRRCGISVCRVPVGGVQYLHCQAAAEPRKYLLAMLATAACMASAPREQSPAAGVPLQVRGVHAVEDLHVWSLTPGSFTSLPADAVLCNRYLRCHAPHGAPCSRNRLKLRMHSVPCLTPYLLPPMRRYSGAHRTHCGCQGGRPGGGGERRGALLPAVAGR